MSSKTNQVNSFSWIRDHKYTLIFTVIVITGLTIVGHELFISSSNARQQLYDFIKNGHGVCSWMQDDVNHSQGQWFPDDILELKKQMLAERNCDK